MIKEVKMYTVECDNCHKTSGDDSIYSCWNDYGCALEDAICSDWIEHEGKHYCPDCYIIGDEDEITIKTLNI